MNKLIRDPGFVIRDLRAGSSIQSSGTAVRDPLVTGLLDDGWLTAREGPLAADTAGDGALIGPDGATAPGLCLLGRMSLPCLAWPLF